MKFIPIIIILALFSSVTALAQEEEKVPRLRKKYINISFVNQKYRLPGTTDLKSYGFGFTVGKTFYVHKKPIAKILRFGIDATWFDFNYSNYDSDEMSFDQPEIAMQVGVSATISPIGKLKLHGYFRVAPSFIAIMVDGDIEPGFATYFVTGGTLSYGVIGLGAEYRFSSHRARMQERNKSAISGMSIHISFRF